MQQAGLHAAQILWESSGRTPLEQAAAQVAQQLWQVAPAGSRVVLVGFSAGGLLARQIAYQHDPQHRISHIITLATPHRGSWLAWARTDAAVRDLRPGSAFLRRLDAMRSTRPDIDYTSLYLPADHLVLPWSSPRLAGTRQVRLPLWPHPVAPRHAGIIGIVLQQVQRAVFDAEAP